MGRKKTPVSWPMVDGGRKAVRFKGGGAQREKALGRLSVEWKGNQGPL